MLPFFDDLQDILNRGGEVFYSLPTVQDQLSSEKYQRLWLESPFSRHYYSPLNPLFSYELEFVQHHPSYPLCLFRDGRKGLGEFFAKNHKPKGPLKKTRVIFPSCLSDMVPRAWRKRACFYKLRPKTTRPTRRKNLLIMGIFNGNYFGRVYLNNLKEKMARFIKGGGNIRLCPLARKEVSSQEAVHPLIAQTQDFFRLIGSDIDLVDEKDVLKLSDMGEYFYHFLSENESLPSDNYMEHHFLYAGARPFIEESPVENPDFVLDFSPHHQVILTRGS